MSGETLREYVWLGLMPIAVIDAGEEAPDTACEADIAAIQAQIEDRQTRLANNANRIAELFGLITDKNSRIANNATRITELGTLSADKTTRIANNAARIAELEALITDKQSRIDTNAARITELGDLIADKNSRIAANAVRINELTLLIAADEAELATLDPVADAVRFAVLSSRISTRSDRVVVLTTRNADLAALITGHETRIAELTARNVTLSDAITAHQDRITVLTARNVELASLRDGHDTRAAELEARNAELAAQITAHEDRIDVLGDRNLTLAGQLAQFEVDLIEAQGNCDTVAVDGLYYLHADHLGRPQFATDPTGAVVWDMGESVTPFGDSVNLAGAFAQQLMFPGQYVDLETGGQGDDVTLSHNWHRTYDPTLGRYLQSDPIGLAGGLNRYAYVGGNPVGYVDSDGQLFFVPILIGMVAGAIIDTAFQYFENGMSFDCFDWKRLAISTGLGAFGGGGGALLKNGARKAGTEWSHAIARRNVDKAFKPGGAINKALNKRGGLNGTWVSKERHARHDWYRRIKGKKVTDKLPAPLRALDRIPDYMKASILAPLAGETVTDSSCEC